MEVVMTITVLDPGTRVTLTVPAPVTTRRT
jgi:hypothetical protein